MKFQISTPRLGRIVSLIFLCSLFAAVTVFAQGRMVIKPIIEAGWQRDTNFHKSDTNTKTVDTFNIKPGIQLGYTTPKSKISLDYYLNDISYDDQDDVAAGQIEADEFDYTEHKLLFGARTNPTDMFSVGLDNLYWKTRDPANADAASNSVERFKYDMNKFSPWLNYRFAEKFGLGLKYTNLMTDYTNDGPGQGEDTDEDRGTFTLFYYLNQKTSFDLDFQYWNRTYDKTTSDYDSSQIMVNVYHQFNRFTVGAGAGYHDREFDETVPTGDIDKFVWKLSVSGQNPPDAAGIPKSSMYISFGSNLNDSGSGETYYESTRLDARFTYLLMEKFNFTLKGWFQNSDYETSDRDDDRWLVSGAVDYFINDIFSIGLEGGTEERDSNFVGKDYENNYVMFNISAAYDFGSR